MLNDSSNGTRPDPLFSTGAYTVSDKRPVEKIAVWPRETMLMLGAVRSNRAARDHISIDSIPYGNGIGNSALLTFHLRLDHKHQI